MKPTFACSVMEANTSWIASSSDSPWLPLSSGHICEERDQFAELSTAIMMLGFVVEDAVFAMNR